MMIVVTELESDCPDLDEQLREVLRGASDQTPVACREHLNSDSSQAMTGGRGGSMVMTSDPSANSAKANSRGIFAGIDSRLAGHRAGGAAR